MRRGGGALRRAAWALACAALACSAAANSKSTASADAANLAAAQAAAAAAVNSVTGAADAAIGGTDAAAPSASPSGNGQPLSAAQSAKLSAAELGVSVSGRVKGPGPRVGYMKLMTPLTEIDPLAVCNDGSPGTYYFRKGTGGSTLWVVYLEGGMWCYSEATCQQRSVMSPWEMSSTKLAPSVALGGIFETSAKNPWADANVAYLPYCSSDAWVGDIGASNFTWGWAFRGQRILAAALRALVTQQGLGGKASLVGGSQRLLLSGCSAGARGAMMNLDYVAGILEDAGVASGQVEVQGLLDSPLWVDVEPSTPHIMPLSNETRAIFELVNASARLGPLCESTYPDYEDRWMCLFGQYRMPLLQTPYLMNAAQDDKFELPYNIGGTTPAGYNVQSWHPDQVAYAQSFGPAVKAVVDTLPASGQEKSAVFSTACFRHCVTDSAAFWNVAIDTAPAAASGGRRAARPTLPVSLRDAANEWYFGRPPQPYRVVADCTGFRCGNCTTKTIKRLKKGGHVGLPTPGAGMTPQRLLRDAFGVLLALLVGVYVLVRMAAQRIAEPQVTTTLLRDKYAGANSSARLATRYGGTSRSGETARLLDDRL